MAEINNSFNNLEDKATALSTSPFDLKTVLMLFMAFAVLLISTFLRVAQAHALSSLSIDTLVYANSTGIRSVKSDGTGDTLLVSTSTVSGAQNPMLSPDRTTMFFQNGTGEMYKANVDGTGVTDLHYTTSGQMAILSPNGKKVAYIVGGVWFGGNGIRIRNADGTGTSTDIHQSVQGTILSGTAWGSWASNSKIVYSFEKIDNNGQVGSNDCYNFIVSLNTNGTGLTYISPDNTSNTPNTCGTPRRPNVNPSVGGVVYALANPHVGLNGSTDLYTVNLDGTSNQLLYSAPSWNQPGIGITYGVADYGHWSPDGSNIAFYYHNPNPTASTGIGIVTSGGTLNTVISATMTNAAWATPVIPKNTLLYAANDGIHSLNQDGTGDTLLISTSQVSGARNPMISPDRSSIYFQSTTYEMYKASADGTIVSDLSYNPSQFASLSPDGSKIAYTNSSSINIRNSDGSGSVTTAYDSSTSGNYQDITWGSNTKLVFFFEKIDNNGVIGANDCYNFLADINTDGTGMTYISPDNTANTPNTCATPRHPNVNVNSGIAAYSSINPHVGLNGSELLYTVNLDGTNTQLLYTPPTKVDMSGTTYGTIDHPHWSPDGSSIVANYVDYNSQSTTGLGFINTSNGTLSQAFHIGPIDLAWTN